MNQLRFQIRPGSAARLAESESGELRAPEGMRIAAGSAAREAEERKRAEGLRSGSSSFSLRGQNGKVVRRESATDSHTAAWEERVRNVPPSVVPQGDRAAETIRDLSRAEGSTPETLPAQSAPSTSPSTLLHRLRSLLS